MTTQKYLTMKPHIITLIALFLTMLFPLNAQNLYVSDEQLKTLDGNLVSVENILSQTGTILVFWETNSAACSNSIENLHEKWLEEIAAFDVKLIVVCVSYPGSWPLVRSVFTGKGWECEAYVDTNGNLKRALGVTTLPYTILLDGDQNIRCRYPGYCNGDENRICEKIIHCLNNSNLEAEANYQFQ